MNSISFERNACAIIIILFDTSIFSQSWLYTQFKHIFALENDANIQFRFYMIFPVDVMPSVSNFEVE